MTTQRYAFFLTLHTMAEIRKSDTPMTLLCHILKVGPEEYFSDPVLADLMLEPYADWEDLTETGRIHGQQASAFTIWLYAMHQKGKDPKEMPVNASKAYFTTGLRTLRKSGKMTNSLSKSLLLATKACTLSDMKTPMAAIITAFKQNKMECDYASLASDICRHIWERDPEEEIRFISRTY